MPTWLLWTLLALLCWGLWAVLSKLLGAALSAEQSQALSTLGLMTILIPLAWPARGSLRGILSARRVLILAYGPQKAEVVRAMIKGPRTPACPASILQGHPNTTLFLDETAAGGLN
jgi:hypothetical protein